MNDNMLQADRSTYLSRIPQSLTFDINAIDRKFGDEAPIVRDIIVFAARTKLRDLWGEVIFTMDEFCSEFGHNRTTMQRTLKKFENVTEAQLPIIEGDFHLWDSLFEYSLYRALNENIVINRKRDGKDVVDSYQIIEKLVVSYKDKGKSSKREKRTYLLKLSDKLLDNLLNEYYLIDYEDYKRLSSTQLSSVGAYRNFYMYMARMIANIRYKNKKQEEEKTEHNYITSIDDLCKILNSNYSESYDRKKYVRKTLNHVQESLKNTPFQWNFTKNGTRYYYFVSFTFPPETLSFFDERLKAVFINKLIDQLKFFYIKKENAEMGDYDIVRMQKHVDKEEFLKWLFEPDSKEIKEKAFRSVYLQVYYSEYEHSEIDMSLLKLEK